MIQIRTGELHIGSELTEYKWNLKNCFDNPGDRNFSANAILLLDPFFAYLKAYPIQGQHRDTRGAAYLMPPSHLPPLQPVFLKNMTIHLKQIIGCVSRSVKKKKKKGNKALHEIPVIPQS